MRCFQPHLDKLKNSHYWSFRRFSLRGSEKVNIDFGLFAILPNLLKKSVDLHLLLETNSKNHKKIAAKTNFTAIFL